MINRKVDIAFISAFHAPFIQDDIDFLKKHFLVRVQIGHGFVSAWKIFWLALRSDVVYCWFASVYASLAVMISRLIRTKSFIVIGGVDVAKEKELGYGIWQSWWKSRLVRYALKNADTILAVDPSLKEDAVQLAGYTGKNILYVPTGYDSEFWKPAGVKIPVVLTVANISDDVRGKVKGLDILLNVAGRLPDVKFVLVGVELFRLSRFSPPPNMIIHPVMDRELLRPFYRHAKVYCQPSRREGLSNSLCEAMLCGCIPVASDVGGNRTAIGDTGALVAKEDVGEFVRAIESALDENESQGLKARARIVSLFPREKRERDILRLIEEKIS